MSDGITDAMSWAFGPKGMTDNEKVHYCNKILDMIGTLKRYSDDPTEDLFLDSIAIEVRRLREGYANGQA
jgi:hypothetical protein